ncbi:MAG: opacity family porin [Sulfurospirillum sp.]
MKKNWVVASLLLLGSSAIFADQNPWFVGGEFGGMNMKYKFESQISGTPYNFGDTVHATYESFKVGKYFDYGRIYGSVIRQNKEDNFSSWSGGLAYDYLFRNSTSITPFIGINGMYSKGKDETQFAKTNDFVHQKGFSYGAEAGVIFTVTTHIDLEIGTRYMDSSDFGKSRSNGADFGEFKGKDIFQYYVGIDYKF